MADLSNLSDDELMTLYNQSAAAPAVAPAAPSVPAATSPGPYRGANLGPLQGKPPATDLSKMSDDELQAAYAASTAPKPSVTADVVSEGAKGIGRGIAGAAGDVGEAIAGPFGSSHHFGNLLADLGLGDRPAPEPSYGQQITTAAGLQPTPQTTAGKYAGTAGEFVGNPESYLGPGGMLAKGVTAAASGVGSEGLGELAQKFAPGSPTAQNAMRLVGAIAGGHAVGVAPRIVSPNPISADRQAMVTTLRNENVPLTAGDRTGSTTLKAAESELSPGVNEAQRNAFTQAAFDRVNEPVGDRPITGRTGAVDTMMNRIGGQFDGLVARNHIDADPQLAADLQGIHTTYNGVPGLYPQETVNSVNGALGRVQQALAQGGSLSGADYQTLRSNLRAAAQGATDPQRAEGLHGVTNALDDAMERTIQRTNSSDAGAWAATRRDYRNALVLQRWASSANMTPATLAQAAKAVYGKNQYVRGMDDFSDLAEAGRKVMSQYQDSGTARRLQIEGILKGLGGVGGFVAGAGHGGAAGAAEGGVAGLLLGELAGPMVARPTARAALMNPATQWYLGNQGVPYRFETSPGTIALMNAIRGGQTQPTPQTK
jgi:hypothetical protein